jgi:peptidoglycan DL-endopeptidase CwlO
LASNTAKTTRHATALGAAAMGVVTASIAVMAPPVYAATSYPSWGDVQQAKANVAKQQAMVTEITGLINGLQTEVSNAQIESEKAAEAYFEAKDALDAATSKLNDLTQQVNAAEAKAKTSQMRAGLLASHLAKSAAGDPSLQLMLNSGNAEDANKLLYQLGAMSKLTEQSQGIYQQAISDKNTVEALTQQASVAKTDRENLANQASTALAAAQSAQAKAQSALALQQQKSTQLVAQLASLKNTSSAIEASYLQGVAVAAAEARAKAAQEAAAAEARAKAAQAGRGGGGGGGSVPAPNGNVVQTAINYAEAQLGKPYIFGGEGPVGYDCSGLTMKAYAYAGVYIGTHSVNNQWYHAANLGEIVPFNQKQRGDLIFWGSGPGSFYHIGIYLGNGMMIAAPQEGEDVKIQSVWGSPYWEVARPAA